MSQLNILADIHLCKATPEPDRTERQAFVVTHGTDMQRMHQALTSKADAPRYILADDPSIPDLRDCVPAPSQQTFWFIDLATNSTASFSGRDWLMRFHQTHTMVIMGDAQCAKTPVAMAYASEIVRAALPEDRNPRFHRTSDLEGLDRSDMLPHVPVVFDDLRPNLARGHNPPYSIEALKGMTDAQIGFTITGKGSNSKSTGAVSFSDRQPRLL